MEQKDIREKEKTVIILSSNAKDIFNHFPQKCFLHSDEEG
jgi:hypothetical protein